MCEKNNDKWNFNIKHNKYKIIIIFQYIIAHNAPSFVPYHKNNNQIGINHSPLQFWLYNDNNQ